MAQPKFISPLPLGFALHTLEEGDFFRKSVKENHYMELEDAVPPESFPYIFKDSIKSHLIEDIYEYVLDHHLNLWKDSKIEVSITRFSNIVPQLQSHGLNTIFIFPSLKTILDTTINLVNKIERDKLKDKQSAIGYLTITSTPENPEFELTKLTLHKLFLEFEKENGYSFIVHSNGDHFEIITSFGELKEMTNQFKNCTLTAFLKKHGSSHFQLGWGVGSTLYEAKQHAESACNHFNDGVYLMTDEELLGPLCKEVDPTKVTVPNKKIIELSMLSGLSELKIQQIIALINKRNSNQVSSEQLAKYLGVTIRSANRILNKLEQKGLAEVEYSKHEKLRGRPKKVYKIIFDQLY
ncbi:hypothetical protein BTR23_16435 [Alkalihalophilus pseudofirmus]|nr:hypothetical protein BTR23_16435 [Alkalihalophilus pseudofirmus]